MAATSAASAAKIDYIVKSIAKITQMETEVDVLEKAQKSADETDRTGQAHIDSRLSAMDDTKNVCMKHVRSLSKEELRVLGTHTDARM